MVLVLLLIPIWLALIFLGTAFARRTANKHKGFGGEVVAGVILRHTVWEDPESESSEYYVGDQSIIQYSYVVDGQKYLGEETGPEDIYSYRYPRPFWPWRYRSVEVEYDPREPSRSRLYDMELVRAELEQKVLLQTVLYALSCATVVGIGYAVLVGSWP